MDFETYAKKLEEKELTRIFNTYYNKINESFQKYEKLVHYVTDGNFTTRGGKIDFNYKKKATIIKKQRKMLSNFVQEIDTFKGTPISWDGQKRIYFATMMLRRSAIKYGYCEEAEQLLKIVTNKDLVGGMREKDVSEDILAIVDNYGKRSILEEKSYRESVDRVVADVRRGEYGQYTSKMLPDERINRTYNGATVVRGDMVFKMDGSVESKSK